jgi:hypothetical protein
MEGKNQMTKWPLLLALLVGPAAAQPFTPSTAPTTSATLALPTSTQVRTTFVSGITGKYIYITGWHIIPVSGTVLTWSAGTGTNCGTGTLILDGPDTYAGNGLIDNLGSGVGALLVVPSGNDLCLTVATQKLSGAVAWGQY